jgi:hypothetical protein
MRKHLATILLTGGAAATALLLSATTALAAPASWTASPGGNYTASQVSGTTSTLTDTTANQTISCTTASDAGSINASASGSPAVVATITSSSFTNCTDAIGDTGWSTTSTGTWDLNGIHFNDGTQTITGCTGTGVTCGTISNISTNVTGNILGAACSFTVTGTVGDPASNTWVTYTNGSDQLFVPNTATLTVSNVSGCSGIINNNDSAEFSGTLVVSPGQTITGTPAG